MTEKEKAKIIHNLFIPWIFEDYDRADLVEAWSSGDKIENTALTIAGLIPVLHISNWEDIKHHWDNEPCEEEGFDKWSDYYEEDGYVEHIPETLEVEWVGEDDENR